MISCLRIKWETKGPQQKHKKVADESRHRALRSPGRRVKRRQRGESSGVQNPHFYFKKSKMVWWETPGEEKVQFFSREKQEHASRTQPHPPHSSPQITLWERKNAVGPQHPFRWACVKLREKEERKATIFETMRCLCSQASDIVALQGSEEDGWWVQCPVLTRTPESSPKMKGFHLKHRGPTLPWLTQCETWIFNFLPPTIHSAQAHIFYWKCIMTCMLVVSRAADLLHGVLESTEP